MTTIRLGPVIKWGCLVHNNCKGKAEKLAEKIWGRPFPQNQRNRARDPMGSLGIQKTDWGRGSDKKNNIEEDGREYPPTHIKTGPGTQTMERGMATQTLATLEVGGTPPVTLEHLYARVTPPPPPFPSRGGGTTSDTEEQQLRGTPDTDVAA